MTGFLTSAVSFIVAIAILVAVHEWGHYIVARWMGVKVLRFSIGFGRVLWSKRTGEDQTEFCISAIPIGGDVKLLDERDCAVPLHEQDRAFNRKSGPAKVAILAAGPGLNFLFAIVAYWCMFVIGVPGAKPLIELDEGTTLTTLYYPSGAVRPRLSDDACCVFLLETHGWRRSANVSVGL